MDRFLNETEICILFKNCQICIVISSLVKRTFFFLFNGLAFTLRKLYIFQGTTFIFLIEQLLLRQRLEPLGLLRHDRGASD